MIPQTKGVPLNVEKLSGSILTVVYVGDSPLLHFPTNQQAWEFLAALYEGDEKIKEVVQVLILYDDSGIRVPQIGRVARNHDGALVYVELFGEPYEAFVDKVKSDWPQIKESLECSATLGSSV